MGNIMSKGAGLPDESSLSEQNGKTGLDKEEGDDEAERMASEMASGEEADVPLLPAQVQSAALSSGRDTLHFYLREIGRFPLLKPEEEYDLARRVRDHNDQSAAFRLVTSHLRLVVKIAMDFQRRWAQNVQDLIQEGNVGLMRAVKKFDPEKGIKFSYYAAFWIKAYILKYIMDNWRMVRIGTTQAQRTLFYNLNKERQRLQSLGFDATASSISKSLNVSEADVREMDQRLAKGDQSLDITLGDDSTSTRLDFLPALTPGIEDILAKDEIAGVVEKHLKSIVPKLSDKERDLLEQRILSDQPVTLREIGDKYGITRERVRQIETRLLGKIREHFAKRIGDFSSEWIRKDE
jgi:RNA polymerase sigma-32 factor